MWVIGAAGKVKGGRENEEAPGDHLGPAGGAQGRRDGHRALRPRPYRAWLGDRRAPGISHRYTRGPLQIRLCSREHTWRFPPSCGPARHSAFSQENEYRRSDLHLDRSRGPESPWPLAARRRRRHLEQADRARPSPRRPGSGHKTPARRAHRRGQPLRFCP